LGSFKVIGEIRTGEHPHGAAVTADGRRFFTTVEGDHTLRVIDTASDQIIQSIKLSGLPNQCAVTPDGKLIGVPIRGSDSVDIVDVAAGKIGSAKHELHRKDDEILHRRRIARGFAISTKEVTIEQFQRFLETSPGISIQRQAFDIATKDAWIRQKKLENQQFLQAHPQFREALASWTPEAEAESPKPEQPITGLTWYEAAQYCRWLSEQEGLPENQMCYPSISEIEKAKQSKGGLKLPADYLTRTAYRLPTEAEWEYACRAGAKASRSYGRSEELLGHYAWYGSTLPALSKLHEPEPRQPESIQSEMARLEEESSQVLRKAGPCDFGQPMAVAQLMPNDLGLFDMHGNASEWCQDRYSRYPASPRDEATEDREDLAPVTVIAPRVVRGGAFNSPAADVRSARRFAIPPTYRDAALGFRVARTCP
jgi:formylglycine-generating enzyme required for sulfatase activity